MAQGLLLLDRGGFVDLLLVVYRISQEQSQRFDGLANQLACIRHDHPDRIDCWQAWWDELMLRVHSRPGWYAAVALPGHDYNCFWGPYADPQTAAQVAQKHTGAYPTANTVEVPFIRFPDNLPWVAQVS